VDLDGCRVFENGMVKKMVSSRKLVRNATSIREVHQRSKEGNEENKEKWNLKTILRYLSRLRLVVTTVVLVTIE
jgi:hypothetical protein